MANERTATTEQQREGSQQQGSRDSQQRGMTRRSGYDPLGFSLLPSSMFGTPFSLLNPFSLIRMVTEDIDRSNDRSGGTRGGRTETTWVPAIEVTQQEGNFIVRAELPGLGPDEVNVEVTDDAVIIEGERKFENEENRSGIRRSERMYGRFYRVVPLPDGANAAQAEARVQDGILEVRIPVTERQNTRRQIPVNTGASSATNTTASQQTSSSQSQS